MKIKKQRYSVWYWLMCLFLALLCVTMVYPLVYTLSMSFSDAAASMTSGWHLYPKSTSLMSYKMVLTGDDVPIGYMNTIYRTLLGTVGTIVLCSMTAYALSRPHLPHRKGLGFVFTFTMLFSGGQVPTYLLIRSLGLMDNRLVYVIPGLVGAYNILIIKSFIKSEIHDSLLESAKIDGANEFTIFFRIVFPLLKPILATVALWSAVAHWNNWMDNMLYIVDGKKQVLAFVLQNLIKENQTGMMTSNIMETNQLAYTSKTIQSATIIVTITPILIAYPFLQKYFVKGIMLGSVKG